MKKIKIFFLILSGILILNSCEDKPGPIINNKALDGSLTFVLNESQYSNLTYVLEDANAAKDMDAFTCVQPDYGFTAAVKYSVQVCFKEDFAKDTYRELPSAVNGEKVNVNTKEMNKAIIGLYGGAIPEPVVSKDIFVRLKAIISDANYTPLKDSLIVKPLLSNVIKVKIKPYIEPLMPYNEPGLILQPYYIVGLGDGAWNNSFAGLGKSLIPLSVVAGNKYSAQGAGEFKFTGYFSASRSFKLIRDIGSWSEQWGNDGADGINKPINKAIAGKEPANLKVPTDGFYTITLNSITNTLSIVASTENPALMSTVGIIGGFNGWGVSVAMTPAETTNNHVWWTTYTFAADGEMKFRANDAWSVNWGNANFPTGLATQDGANIKNKAGKYTIIFNDVDGCYYFAQ